MSNFGYPVEYSAVNIDKLANVEASSPADGDTLAYNTSKKVWRNVASGAPSPGGADTQVQFNDSGALSGDAGLVFDKATGELTATKISDGAGVTITTGDIAATGNIIAGTIAPTTLSVTGNAKLAENAGSKIGLFGATEIVQPTTSIASATFVANSLAIPTQIEDSTWGGYKIGQIVQALQDLGILA